jgi:hypothetical protein
MKKLIGAVSAGCVFLAIGCVVRAPSGEGSIEQWNARHPEAARELCGWVSAHREAAHLFFEWDAAHWDRSHEFVVWAISHPAQNIDIFVAQHPGWPDFNAIAETRRPAADAFIAWCRRHPEASQELVNHRNGLHWAGNHLGC